VRVAGVDGTKGGWVAILLDDGRFAGDRLLQPIETTWEELADAQVVAIDIPIGYGPREADTAARALLTGAASTVFSTPTREALEKTFGPGLGVSAQAHALGPRIKHVTVVAERDTRIYEVHPEVSFRAMNAWRPLSHRKKSAGGALERIALLNGQGIALDHLDVAGSVPLDDVVDAAAAAWTAYRIGLRIAEAVPAAAHHGARLGVIWY
jgi:predicted RNase H-like nuclease